MDTIEHYIQVIDLKDLMLNLLPSTKLIIMMMMIRMMMMMDDHK